jgi:hypothetical protein
VEIREAIVAFAQSEKIKSGIIWASQAAEMYTGLEESEKNGARKILRTLIAMIAHEIHLCKRAAPHELWIEVDKDLNSAQVMIDSQIVHESIYHLTQALTKITTIGQQSLTRLSDQGLV